MTPQESLTDEERIWAQDKINSGVPKEQVFSFLASKRAGVSGGNQESSTPNRTAPTKLNAALAANPRGSLDPVLNAVLPEDVQGFLPAAYSGAKKIVRGALRSGLGFRGGVVSAFADPNITPEEKQAVGEIALQGGKVALTSSAPEIAKGLPIIGGAVQSAFKAAPVISTAVTHGLAQSGGEAAREVIQGEPLQPKRIALEGGMVSGLGALQGGAARLAARRAGLPQEVVDFALNNPKTAFKRPTTEEGVTLVEQLQKNLKDALGEPQMAPGRFTDRVPKTPGRQMLDNIISRADEHVGLQPNTLGGRKTTAGMVDGRVLVDSLREAAAQAGGDQQTQTAAATISKEADAMLERVAAKASAHPQNRSNQYGQGGVYSGGGGSVVSDVTPEIPGKKGVVFVRSRNPVEIPGRPGVTYVRSRNPASQPPEPDIITGKTPPFEPSGGGSYVGTEGPPSYEYGGSYVGTEGPSTPQSVRTQYVAGPPRTVNTDRPLLITHKEYDDLLREHLTKPSVLYNQRGAPTVTTEEETANSLRDIARAKATSYGYDQLNRENVTYPQGGKAVTAREAGQQAADYMNMIEELKSYFPEGKANKPAVGGVVKAGQAGEAMVSMTPSELGYRIEKALKLYSEKTGDPIYEKFKEMIIRHTFTDADAQPYLAKMARIYLHPGSVTAAEAVRIPTSQKMMRFMSRRTARPAIRSATAEGVGAVAYPPYEKTKEEDKK